MPYAKYELPQLPQQMMPLLGGADQTPSPYQSQLPANSNQPPTFMSSTQMPNVSEPPPSILSGMGGTPPAPGFTNPYAPQLAGLEGFTSQAPAPSFSQAAPGAAAGMPFTAANDNFDERFPGGRNQPPGTPGEEYEPDPDKRYRQREEDPGPGDGSRKARGFLSKKLVGFLEGDEGNLIVAMLRRYVGGGGAISASAARTAEWLKENGYVNSKGTFGRPQFLKAYRAGLFGQDPRMKAVYDRLWESKERPGEEGGGDGAFFNAQWLTKSGMGEEEAQRFYDIINTFNISGIKGEGLWSGNAFAKFLKGWWEYGQFASEEDAKFIHSIAERFGWKLKMPPGGWPTEWGATGGEGEGGDPGAGTGENPFGDPYALFLSLVPILEQMRDREFASSAALLGNQGARYGSAWQRKSAEIAGETTQAMQYALQKLLYDQVQSDLDRALSAAVSGIGAGGTVEDILRGRIDQLLGAGTYETMRMDEILRLLFDDARNNQYGIIPLLLQFASGASGFNIPQPGESGFMDWLREIFG